ncbi:MAG TPA: hypothetical protein VGX25_13735 [Actinophytocola sp.]|uniref:hypothetical protein n=1 Tax=Actinophytocola sp. TaxID=1872138 RepID=UPI002DDD4979|nr:hypothetical protein [Actinophytocola sp.]HEV2780446.1 hypothetical protein [Actinophytocola sp.]
MVAGVLLLGGGLGGYFIGAASDHDRDRPGISRHGDHGPGQFRDGPRFRQER